MALRPFSSGNAKTWTASPVQVESRYPRTAACRGTRAAPGLIGSKGTGKYQRDSFHSCNHHALNLSRRFSFGAGEGQTHAAQFSPFAALVGYDAAVKETARLAGARVELDDCEKAALNKRLPFIADTLGKGHEAAVTYFLPGKKNPTPIRLWDSLLFAP